MCVFFPFRTAVFTFVLVAVSFFAQAQENINSNIFQAQMRAADSVMLVSEDRRVRLWGVESVAGMPPAFNLNARTALANAF